MNPKQNNPLFQSVNWQKTIWNNVPHEVFASLNLQQVINLQISIIEHVIGKTSILPFEVLQAFQIIKLNKSNVIKEELDYIAKYYGEYLFHILEEWEEKFNSDEEYEKTSQNVWITARIANALESVSISEEDVILSTQGIIYELTELETLCTEQELYELFLAELNRQAGNK